tara:strand:+ start:192 stop:1514 length:1323 start_codon:yes stop_codon:yes gene_type:complete
MSDFKEDDFDNFDDNNFDDFGSGNSLKDGWQNNSLLKIFAVVAVIIAVIAAIMIFGGDDEELKSTVRGGLDRSEPLGGEISQNYAEVLETVNEQRLNDAVQTGGSSIPMLINPEETELLTETEENPPYQEFDPLATFRQNAGQPEPTEQTTDETPVLLEPEQVFTQQQPAVPAPNPEAVQQLATAMSGSVEGILSMHSPASAKVIQISSKEYLDQLTEAQNPQNPSSTAVQMVDTDGDGIPDTQLGVDGENGEVVIETILVPAGTINYAQVLIEANSDVPGPVLVQLVSGPMAGARMIGSFSVVNDLLVLRFNSIVIDGLNQGVSAIALDPNTTLPGVASEVNQRYFRRVLLPAAAKFLQGVGSAIAQDSTQTIIVRDTVIQDQPALDFEQELGRGAEAAFKDIAEFMEDEGDSTQALVRLARGTPIGVFFLEPVTEEQN